MGRFRRESRKIKLVRALQYYGVTIKSGSRHDLAICEQGRAIIPRHTKSKDYVTEDVANLLLKVGATEEDLLSRLF